MTYKCTHDFCTKCSSMHGQCQQGSNGCQCLHTAHIHKQIPSAPHLVKVPSYKLAGLTFNQVHHLLQGLSFGQKVKLELWIYNQDHCTIYTNSKGHVCCPYGEFPAVDSYGDLYCTGSPHAMPMLVLAHMFAPKNKKLSREWYNFWTSPPSRSTGS